MSIIETQNLTPDNLNPADIHGRYAIHISPTHLPMVKKVYIGISGIHWWGPDLGSPQSVHFSREPGLRLLLIISSLSSGGAERVLSRLANNWVEKHWEITFVTTHDAGKPHDYQISKKINYISVDPMSNKNRQFKTIRSIREVIVSDKPDAVVSFLTFTNIITLIATIGLSIPVIISERLDPRVKKIGALWSALRHITYPRATCLIAQTTTAADLFEHYCPKRVRVIPNPVIPLIEEENSGPESPWGGPTAIAVGRLHWQKGFDIALHAMALLPPEASHLRLVILGEGSARKELLALRDKLGLADRVDFPGRVPSTAGWLKSADIFISSSRTEGFPNALCEAMAAGLPVVSTDCPSGPADIINPGINGLLIPVENPQALANGMAQLLFLPEQAVKMGNQARDILNRFSSGTVLGLWDKVFIEFVGKK